MSLSPIADIVADIKAGKMVILVDDEDRENEGDLIIASQFVTPEAINFMATHGRGLICLTLTEARCQQLNLPLMVQDNRAPHRTAFTVSIEAAEGVTTGISAHDRSRTVQAAVAANARPSDIIQPGHIFPLMAQNGGVLVRAGHTEAGCDLAELAGLEPSGVICEVLKDDGTMARLPDLLEFGARHGIRTGTIADLIQYRGRNENLVRRVTERTIDTGRGDYRLISYLQKSSGESHLALVLGDIDPQGETLVRVHHPTSLIDILDHGESGHSFSVHESLEYISHCGAGVMLLLSCGESTSQLFERVAAPVTPRATPRSNLLRFGIGAQILKDLGVARMRLLAAPRRIPSMTGFGLEVTHYVERPEVEQTLRSAKAGASHARKG